MKGYVEDVHLFPENLINVIVSGEENITGRSSLYIFSQLPFVEIFILPVFLLSIV